jgi:hypothetical protein
MTTARRGILWFGLALAALPVQLQAAESTQWANVLTDPVTGAEAEAGLQFAMRLDPKRGTPYIYPSEYDAQAYPAMIQYRAVELDNNPKDPIKNTTVEVCDPSGNVVWRSIAFTAKNRPPGNKSNNRRDWWWNTTFAGTTNVDGTNDGSPVPQPNHRDNLFKFLDPGRTGKATYTARLTVVFTSSKRTLVIDNCPFEARARSVGVSKEIDTEFGAFGKAWLWYKQKLTSGKAPDLSRDPASAASFVYLSLSELKGWDKKDPFAPIVWCDTFRICTPRSVLWSIGHGWLNEAKGTNGITIKDTLYNGFRWGGNDGNYLDIAPSNPPGATPIPRPHALEAILMHCWSGINAEGGPSPAKSYYDCQQGKVSGDDLLVRGYDKMVFVRLLASFQYGIRMTIVDARGHRVLDKDGKEVLVPANISTDFNRNYLQPCIQAAARDPQIGYLDDGNYVTGAWIATHDIVHVNDVNLNKDDIMKKAIELFWKNSQFKDTSPPFVVVYTAPIAAFLRVADTKMELLEHVGEGGLKYDREDIEGQPIWTNRPYGY